VLSVISTIHDSDVQMYPKQVRLWGMISSQSLGHLGYARDCHLHISSNRVGNVGKAYREGTVQCLRLGLVHMLLASSLSLALMQAISYAIVCGVVEKTKG